MKITIFWRNNNKIFMEISDVTFIRLYSDRLDVRCGDVFNGVWVDMDDKYFICEKEGINYEYRTH